MIVMYVCMRACMHACVYVCKRERETKKVFACKNKFGQKVMNKGKPKMDVKKYTTER
jgi:hypothetical protein